MLRPEQRQELVRTYMGALGYTHDEAVEIVDLSVHATKAASEAAHRVALSASSLQVAAQVADLTAQFTVQCCEAALEASKRRALAEGQPIHFTRPA